MKKQIELKFKKVKNKNKIAWINYGKEKIKIENRHLSSNIKVEKIKQLLKKTRLKIKNNWYNYREEKYLLTHISPYKNTILIKRKKLGIGEEKSFKIRKNNYKSVFDQIKNDDKIRYILVILKIKMDETDKIIYISDSYTLIRLRKIDSNNVINNTLEKFLSQKKYEGFTLIETTIRLIYESIKKTSRK